MAVIEIGKNSRTNYSTRVEYGVRLAWHQYDEGKPKRLAVFVSGTVLKCMGWSRGDQVKLLFDDEGPALIVQRCGKGAGRTIGKNGKDGGIIHVPNMPTKYAAHFIGDDPRVVALDQVTTEPAADQLRIPARNLQPKLLELS